MSASSNPAASVVGLYPAQAFSQMQALPAPEAGAEYLVFKCSGNFSESGIHGGISLVPPLLVALARSNISQGKAAALNKLISQIAVDVGNAAPLGAYAALLPGILALVNAQ